MVWVINNLSGISAHWLMLKGHPYDYVCLKVVALWVSGENRSGENHNYFVMSREFHFQSLIGTYCNCSSIDNTPAWYYGHAPGLKSIICHATGREIRTPIYKTSPPARKWLLLLSPWLVWLKWLTNIAASLSKSPRCIGTGHCFNS